MIPSATRVDIWKWDVDGTRGKRGTSTWGSSGYYKKSFRLTLSPLIGIYSTDLP